MKIDLEKPIKSYLVHLWKYHEKLNFPILQCTRRGAAPKSLRETQEIPILQHLLARKNFLIIKCAPQTSIEKTAKHESHQTIALTAIKKCRKIQ